MALTRPTFNNINTSTVQAYFSDPQVTLNYGNVTANNQDIGFVLNRGSSGNVAVVWNETTKGFVLAYTTSSGLTSGNIAVSAKANIAVGNLQVSGTSVFSGGITGTTISAATIGNTGATVSGTTGSFTTSVTTGTLSAATIGNTGATLVGTTANISGNATFTGNVVNGNVFATGYFYANGYAFTGGGGGNPGGTSGQIQYNSGGTFTGASGVVTDGANLTLNAQGDLKFADSDSSNWVALQAPDTITSNVTWTLPAADGTANQALVTNGTGTLSWAAAGAAITNDTTTATLYPSMATTTSGYLTDARVSSTKLTFNASTGILSSTALTTTGDVTIGGNLLVNGTTVTINATTVTTNDKNIVVANNQTTSATVDGSGIDAGGGTPIATWRYSNATTSWQSNIGITPAINNTLSLGGASNYWSSLYATTINGTLSSGAQNNITSATGITTLGNITTGTWSGSFGAVSGAKLTNLTAANLVGTIPSAVLGNSTHYIGTTAITLNRASGSQTLTGVSIDGSAASATTATTATTATNQSGGTVSATTGAFSTSITRNSRNVPTYTGATTAPTSPLMGDFWYETSSDILHQYIYDGTSSFWVDISSALVNSSTSATANTLALRDANADLYATVFRGKATSAQYADLAENYAADAEYEPGTVVVFGGDKEITVTNTSHDYRVAGVISTQPAYLMNSESEGLPVAFTGRVPCWVQGPVKKGELLVTSPTPGVAIALDRTKYIPGCVVGKSLEEKITNDVTTIEVVVGRF